jgi:hypothetical protein
MDYLPDVEKTLDGTYSFMLIQVRDAQARGSPPIKEEFRTLFPNMLEHELNGRIATLMQSGELLVHKKSVHDKFIYLVPTNNP